jgi:uncharacterized protein YjbI with pentapeptide repeats
MANLCEANLEKANLYGANLNKANLDGTNLKETTLTRATYTIFTQWPPNFDPIAHGATLVDNQGRSIDPDDLTKSANPQPS